MKPTSKPLDNSGARPRGEYETHALELPPSLWQELEELVPPGERSAVIQKALERELKRRRRAAKQSPLPAAPALPEDPWRVAAAAAREYYETDPEAVEWAMFAGDTLDEEE